MVISVLCPQLLGIAPRPQPGLCPWTRWGLLSLVPRFCPPPKQISGWEFLKGNERRGKAGRNRTEGAREEGREEGRRGLVKSVKPRARNVASPPLLMHLS